MSNLNKDFSTPPNQLELIMKKFESALSEISHNLKNSNTQLYREKIQSYGKKGCRVKRNLGPILTTEDAVSQLKDLEQNKRNKLVKTEIKNVR